MAQNLDICDVKIIYRVRSSKPTLGLEIDLLKAKFDDRVAVTLFVPVIGYVNS